jgi:cobalt-zinc-cadmium efflux system protein
MGAGHSHAPAGSSRSLRTRLAIAFGLTATIVVAQAVGTLLTGSLALLTDTAHAIADASGLLVALVAASLMLRPPSSRRTWGFARVEVLAALGQATLLLVVGGYTTIEAVRRLFDPPEVASDALLVFGVIGLVANVTAIAVLSSSREANLNMRAAFLEVLNDALGSMGVIVAAIVITTTGFHRADALAGLFIAALILPRAYRIARDSVRVLMEFTPTDVDLDEVREHLLEMDHVRQVHDLHASTVGTGLPVLSGHVVVDDECFMTGHAPTILEDIQHCVSSHFPIAHTTIQLETTQSCPQEHCVEPKAPAHHGHAHAH